MLDTIPRPQPVMGFVGILSGSIALVSGLAVFLAHPVAQPYPMDGFLPLDPLAVEPLSRGIDDYLHISAVVLAIMAIFTGLAGLVRRESWAPATAAMLLGAGTLLSPVATVAVLMGAVAAWKSVTSRRLSLT